MKGEKTARTGFGEKKEEIGTKKKKGECGTIGGRKESPKFYNLEGEGGES